MKSLKFFKTFFSLIVFLIGPVLILVDRFYKTDLLSLNEYLMAVIFLLLAVIFDLKMERRSN